MNISQMASSLRHSLAKHSPEILIGIGISGMVASTIMAVRATPKALKMLDRERDRREQENLDNGGAINPISKIDTVKIVWKYYIPCVATTALSITCIILASTIKTKRNAALAAAYTLSESALKEYQRKVVETIGEKKEEAIHDSIAKDRVENDPVSNKEVFFTGKGDTLFYDLISGRYFKSDIDSLKKIVNELNRSMISDMYVSLNDFYYEVGLKSIDVGDDLGWNVSKGLIDLKFSCQLAEDGTTPCVVLDYTIKPIYDYSEV